LPTDFWAALLRSTSIIWMCTVLEQHIQQIGGGRRGIDGPAKALCRQLGQQPAVVDVGMGQQHKVDAARIKAEGLLVVLLGAVAALGHAAVDQKAAIPQLHQKAGTGDRLRGPVKRDLHRNTPPVHAPVRAPWTWGHCPGHTRTNCNSHADERLHTRHSRATGALGLCASAPAQRPACTARATPAQPGPAVPATRACTWSCHICACCSTWACQNCRSRALAEWPAR
jgi:hypothetical protein